MSNRTTRHGTNGHKRNGHASASRTRSGTEPLQTAFNEAPSPPDPKPANEPLQTEVNGRTTKGTFAPGNTFARGNPSHRQMAGFRSALLAGLTAERMQVLGDKLYARALYGDMAAAKLLLVYAIGRPPEAVDADRLDLDEWHTLTTAPEMEEYLRLVSEGKVDPQVAAVFKRLRPKAIERFLERSKQGPEEAEDDSETD